MYSSLFKFIIGIYIFYWLSYYFKRLPKDLRDIKKKKELMKTRFDPVVLSQFKSNELKEFYIKECVDEYRVTLSNLIFFWCINIVLIFIFYWLVIDPLFSFINLFG